MKKRILILDDKETIAKVLSIYLMAEYDCIWLQDGVQGMKWLQEGNLPNLIISDIRMPEMRGDDFLEWIKANELFKHIPVIMLSSEDSTTERIRLLEIGAEDYIVKPFEIVELLARVEVVLRRYKKTATVISFGDVTLDTVARTVTKGGYPVDMTVKEYDLLLLLVRNPGIALFRETLFDRVWGYDYIGETRTLDSHIQRLRRKLDWNKKIITVYKVGYRFDPHGGE